MKNYIKARDLLFYSFRGACCSLEKREQVHLLGLVVGAVARILYGGTAVLTVSLFEQLRKRFILLNWVCK